MKQIYTFFAVMMMAMAIPNKANAYDFSAVSPSGHTLYYNIVGNVVHVVPQNSSYPYNTVNLVGNLIIPDSVTNDGTTYMVAQIGNYAFYGVCSGLTSVSIPTTVSYIGEYAFRACGITSLVIPDGVITIANNAFSDCASLETVSIGESVETIYPAFTGCQWLTTLNFNAVNCSNMYFYAMPSFYDNINLTTLNIGENVQFLPSYAFYGCTNLEEIHSSATTAPFISTTSFSEVSSTIPVYIPCEGRMSYFARWCFFSNLITEGGFSLSVNTTDSTMGNAVVLSHPTCQSPIGIIYADPTPATRFLSWSDGDSNNPRTLTLTSDTSLSASFTIAVPDTVLVHDTITITDTLWLTQYDTVWLYDTVTIHDTIYIHDEGIEDVDILNARIFQRDGRIVVESGDGGPLGGVRVFDVTGRMLTHSSVSPQGAASSPNLGEQFGWRATFDVPTSGTYIVKIGDHPAKKIMVIR